MSKKNMDDLVKCCCKAVPHEFCGNCEYAPVGYSPKVLYGRLKEKFKFCSEKNKPVAVSDPACDKYAPADKSWPKEETKKPTQKQALVEKLQGKNQERHGMTEQLHSYELEATSTYKFSLPDEQKAKLIRHYELEIAKLKRRIERAEELLDLALKSNGKWRLLEKGEEYMEGDKHQIFKMDCVDGWDWLILDNLAGDKHDGKDLVIRRITFD